MATTREEIAKLQKDVRRLKSEYAKLWRVLREHGIVPKDGESAAEKKKRALSDNERGIEILRRAGMIRELTPEEKEIAAKWDARPEQEKREAIKALQSLKLDPPLSQTVIEGRG